MTSITTKFLPATNHRGSRYRATAGEGGKGFTLTVEADHGLDSDGNHYRVARQLIERLGWFHDDARADRYADWFGGGTPTGYVFVCAVSYAKVDRLAWQATELAKAVSR